MKTALACSLLVASTLVALRGQDVGRKTSLSVRDVLPILGVLRSDLVPGELTGKTPLELERGWPAWVSSRDAAIRARVAQGDEDSLIYLLLFGTAFTGERRANERELAALAVQPGAAGKSLARRLTDLVAAAASPGADERLQFVRQVLIRNGIDPGTVEGRVRAQRWLEDRAARVAGSGLVRSTTLLDPSAAAIDTQTLFRDRGLASDTSIFIDYGIDETLERITATGLVPSGTIRRVAIVGPGLDFSDKLEGYDFYPQQTIQPFATIDSLRRHGLISTDFHMTAIDLSPRVIQHLEMARERAAAGHAYPMVFPRNTGRAWSEGLVGYWRRAGDRIGEAAPASPPPPTAGPVEVRRVLVRPSAVLSIVPRDLNVVVDRLDLSAGEPFDLVVATNILLYYGVFEQALAVANIAHMMRPGGVLLTNNRVFELPSVPIREVGATDVTYMTLTGIGNAGDRIVWYQRQ
jgi:hypothetical protein